MEKLTQTRAKFDEGIPTSLIVFITSYRSSFKAKQLTVGRETLFDSTIFCCAATTEDGFFCGSVINATFTLPCLHKKEHMAYEANNN